MENPNPSVEDGIWPWSTFFVFLLLAILLGGMLGSLLVYLLSTAYGVSLSIVLENLESGATAADRNFVRSVLLIRHLTSFALPALVTAYFFYRKRWITGLKLNLAPAGKDVVWGTLFIVVAFPLSQAALWLNKQIPLPAWAREMEASAAGLTENLLRMESPGELVFTLLVIAVIPAIGEELVYRGLLQNKLMERLNPHVAIWVAALIFSAFHLQLEGLLPRMLLGAILGYAFYWTQNLWVPIIAHFFLNGIQVIVPYFYKDAIEQMSSQPPQEINWWGILFSAMLTFGVGYTLMKGSQTHEGRAD